jgi:DNA (cytosine-5)-methyltransferase 1
MPKKKSYLTVTDQFCGAGGSSLGAAASGMEVMLAMNHWELAIKTHNTNFPAAAPAAWPATTPSPRH